MKHITTSAVGLLVAFCVHAQTPPPAKVAPAYYVAEFELTDAEAIRPYSARVESTFRPFSGRYIVRGGSPASLEGEPPRGRLIVIAFDSLSQARAWYDSAEYRELLPIRHSAGRSRVYIVEGLPPP